VKTSSKFPYQRTVNDVRKNEEIKYGYADINSLEKG
jgi:hypothetical protein